MKYTPKIEKAIRRATLSHDGLYRKETAGGKRLPYVSHLFSVASIVSEHTDDEDVIAAALLHDILEDTPLTPDELIGEFGKRVHDIVDSLSEDYAYKNEKLPTRGVKLLYVEKLKKSSKEALLIACADKIHNLQSSMAMKNIQSRQLPEDFFKFHKAVLGIIEKGLGIDHSLVKLHRNTFKNAEKILIKK